MDPKLNAASASDNPSLELPCDPAELQRELSALNQDMTQVELKIRDLRAQEDFEKGLYLHDEIFEAQQEKLRLQVEIDVRTNRIKRLEFGQEG